MSRNILIKIAYDGTNFSGWQRQPHARTVCGTIEEALKRLTGSYVKLDGTSRTDAGVHALGQCASFHLPDKGIPTERIPLALNNLLAADRLESISDIRILEAKEMPESFHARYSSKGKRYIYRIYNCKEKSIFRRTQFYQIAQPLNIEAMKKASSYIEGVHDFAAFQSAGSTVRETTVREIYRLDIETTPDASDTGDFAGVRNITDSVSAAMSGNIVISIEGNGFLYNMVRIIVGTLVEVGLGRRTPESVRLTVESKDRGKAGHTAPPQGLYLDEVFY